MRGQFFVHECCGWHGCTPRRCAHCLTTACGGSRSSLNVDAEGARLVQHRCMRTQTLFSTAARLPRIQAPASIVAARPNLLDLSPRYSTPPNCEATSIVRRPSAASEINVMRPTARVKWRTYFWRPAALRSPGERSLHDRCFPVPQARPTCLPVGPERGVSMRGFSATEGRVTPSPGAHRDLGRPHPVTCS